MPEGLVTTISLTSPSRKAQLRARRLRFQGPCAHTRPTPRSLKPPMIPWSRSTFPTTGSPGVPCFGQTTPKVHVCAAWTPAHAHTQYSVVARRERRRPPGFPGVKAAPRDRQDGPRPGPNAGHHAPHAPLITPCITSWPLTPFMLLPADPGGRRLPLETPFFHYNWGTEVGFHKLRASLLSSFYVVWVVPASPTHSYV